MTVSTEKVPGGCPLCGEAAASARSAGRLKFIGFTLAFRLSMNILKYFG